MYLSQHISNTFSWLHLLGVNSYIQVLIAPNDHRFFCYYSPILSVNNSLRALQYVYEGDNVQTTYFNNVIASSCTTDLTPFFQRYSTEECGGSWRQWTTFLTINSHAVTKVLGSCNQYNHCNHAWSTTTATMHAVQPWTTTSTTTATSRTNTTTTTILQVSVHYVNLTMTLHRWGGTGIPLDLLEYGGGDFWSSSSIGGKVLCHCPHWYACTWSS